MRGRSSRPCFSHQLEPYEMFKERPSGWKQRLSVLSQRWTHMALKKQTVSVSTEEQRWPSNRYLGVSFRSVWWTSLHYRWVLSGSTRILGFYCHAHCIWYILRFTAFKSINLVLFFISLVSSLLVFQVNSKLFWKIEKRKLSQFLLK